MSRAYDHIGRAGPTIQRLVSVQQPNEVGVVCGAGTRSTAKQSEISEAVFVARGLSKIYRMGTSKFMLSVH